MTVFCFIITKSGKGGGLECGGFWAVAGMGDCYVYGFLRTQASWYGILNTLIIKHHMPDHQWCDIPEDDKGNG